MLRRSSPASQGVSSTGVLAFVEALEASPDIEPHSLMLLRHGQVVAEGWWSPYAPDHLQLLYSLSKSFTATALGLAVAEGLVGLDDTVLSWFPELDGDVTDPRSRAMLIHHLASMTSGHLEDTVARAEAMDPADLVRGFLLTPPDQEPGSIFAYNQPCTYTIAAIIARASGGSLTDYLRPRLLGPLGIGEVAWTRDDSGRDLGYSGLHATTDAIARLGQLYLRRGVWNGQRLLSEEWVQEATRRHVATSVREPVDWQQGYGFQFWRSRHGYRGDGAFGQFCVVLPEQDTVLAVTSATRDMQAVLDAAWEHLLPAIDSVSPEADAGLALRLLSLSLSPVPGTLEPPPGRAADWARFRADVENGPLSAVAVTRTDAGWRAELSPEAAPPLVVPLGSPDWTIDRSGPTDNPVPVAVSGGWSGGETLRLDVIFIETPHRLQVTCRLTDAEALAQWVTAPLHGSLLDLRAPPRQ